MQSVYLCRRVCVRVCLCPSLCPLPFNSGRAQSCSSMTTPSRTGSMGGMSSRTRIIGWSTHKSYRGKNKTKDRRKVILVFFFFFLTPWCQNIKRVITDAGSFWQYFDLNKYIKYSWSIVYSDNATLFRVSSPVTIQSVSCGVITWSLPNTSPLAMPYSRE